MIEGHGGNIWQLAAELGCAPSGILDMSSNVNPFGPPPGLLEFLEQNLSVINALPEADARSARHAFGRRYGIAPEQVMAANGTTWFIHAIPQALKSRNVLILGPTYSDYADACRMHDVPYDFFMRTAGRNFDTDMTILDKTVAAYDTVFICNPNNPTGRLIPADELKRLCTDHPQTFFIIDESYLPFVADESGQTLIHCGLPNVIILNSMSKIFRIPGLRIGFLVAEPQVIERLARYALPWSVNSLAQKAVCYLMEQEVRNFVDETRQFLDAEREFMSRALGESPEIQLFQSCTSFVLCRLSGKHRAETVCAALARERILIRNCSNFQGLSDRFIRISLKTGEINRLLAEKLLKILAA